MNIVFTWLCWGFVAAALEVIVVFGIVRVVKLIRNKVETKWLWMILLSLVAQAAVMFAIGMLVSFTAGA